MTKKLILVLLIIFTSLFTGCTVTRMLSEKGRSVNTALDYYSSKSYTASMLLLLDTLDQNPDYKDAYENLNEKFPKVVAMKSENIARLTNSDSKTKYEELAKEYDCLYQINKRAESLTNAAKSKIKFEVLSTIPLKEKMAENYYIAGSNYAHLNGRDNKKTAAKMFSAIVKWYPEYKDSKLQYDTLREEAMQRVMFSPIKSNVRRGVDISALIYGNVNSYVVNSKDLTEFTQIIAREQVDTLLSEQKLALEGVVDPATVAKIGKTLGANIVVDIEIPVVSYTEEEPTRSQSERTWEETTGSETYKDSQTGLTKVRETKRKRYYTEISYSKQNKVIISINYSIKDIATSQVLKTDRFNQEADDSAYWTVYRGDYPTKVRSSSEPTLASESELLTKCSDIVSKRLASSIIEYFK